MTESARYPIPASRHRVEREIKRSRFITTVGPAPTVEAAREFIASVGDEFAGASHNCWAYVVGPPGSTAQIGMSDAGEPHGTAGRPMLTVILHSGIGDLCAVVTRFFGGTLLGKGGLVRAYGGGVRLALESMPVEEKIRQVRIALIVDYAAVTPMKRLLPQFEAVLLEEDYAMDVTYQIMLPEERYPQFVEAMNEMTNGQVVIESI